MKGGAWRRGREQGFADVFGADGDGKARCGSFDIPLKAEGSHGAEVDGGDGGDVGEGEGVAADAGAEVENVRYIPSTGGGESGGFVAGDGGIGGLLEGFGDAPEKVEGGEFSGGADGFELQLGKGECGVDVGGGMCFSKGADVGDGWSGADGDEVAHGREQTAAFVAAQEFQGRNCDPRVVGDV